ncbi:MAG: glyoxylate/hydroxypyruvate reductase A [Pseudomonadota bacterium]
MIPILFAGHSDDWPTYERPLDDAFAAAGIAADITPEIAPEIAQYLIYAPNSAYRDFNQFPRAKAVLNLWAGVEDLIGNRTLNVPLCRMVEPGLTEGMVEWVTGMVLRHHLAIDRYVMSEAGWDPIYPPLARDRTVGILGLGELGAACGGALASLNFRVMGWSRTIKTFGGIETFAGDEGLVRVLKNAEILVLLLPLTPSTESVIDAAALALMRDGAVLINPGRGALIDDTALLSALDHGRLTHATLDVFRTEPLSADHPYWRHPRVTVTPHVASATRPDTAARAIAENVRRGEAGEPYLGLVDRSLMY